MQSTDHFTGIGIFLDTCVLPPLSVRKEMGLIIRNFLDTKTTCNPNIPSLVSSP